MPSLDQWTVIGWIVGAFVGILAVFTSIILYAVSAKLSFFTELKSEIEKRFEKFKSDFFKVIDELKQKIEKVENSMTTETRRIHDRIDRIEKRLNCHVEDRRLHAERRKK